MKIFISEIDRLNAKNVALKNISRYFDIPDWEFKTNEDLKQALDNLHTSDADNINKLLNDYFEAYDKWFDFYQRIRVLKSDSEYELNTLELQELQDLINKREQTLTTLQNEFDNLQLQKFNIDRFGKEISGIAK
jgi:hypothetical protein